MAEHLDGRVPPGDVPQEARHDAPAPERLAVGADRVFRPRAAGDVGEGLRLQDLPGLLLEFLRRERLRGLPPQ
jgi:hypothetical protein